ncbi:Na+/H+ antiporter NhaA [Limnohabitans sp. T6-5]|uniref:Na+/H+ antiporter NhaA n=1 Tax=Limnohabitans sp. T6-5 TaxID=1100724 RepID=UPI000D35FE64|nr:Na+/H+ antiporter NhaA [Limnohabitans sp. T6-5]
MVALAWANSPWVAACGQMLGIALGISFGEQVLRLDLRHWINDGLMANRSAFFLTKSPP